MSISLVEGYMPSVFKSMQNVQILTGTGSCYKCAYKYIARIDEQSYVVINVDRKGMLVTKEIFLYNTKVTVAKPLLKLF